MNTGSRPEIDCDVSPKRREVTGLEHQHLVSARQGVDQSRLLRAGSRGWIDHDGLMRLKYRPDTRDHLTSERPELRSSMVDRGTRHRPQDPVRDVGWTWNLQKMAAASV